MTTRVARLCILPVLAIGLLISLSTSHLLPRWAPVLPHAEESARVLVERAFGRLPLYFVQNQGQVDEQVAYTIQGADKTLYFTSTGVTFALTSAQEKEGSSDGASSEPVLFRPDALPGRKDGLLAAHSLRLPK